MCGKNSCFHNLCTEHGFADVSKQILSNDTSHDHLDQLFQSIPDSIWQDIDDIINSVDLSVDVAVNQQQQQQQQQHQHQQQQQQLRRKLVRKRKYHDVFVPTKQLNYDFGLERQNKAKLDDEFAKPKTYQCDYCPADMLSVHVYVSHLKHHREAELRHRMSRCNGCGLLFNDIIETKWHQMRCLTRTRR